MYTEFYVRIRATLMHTPGHTCMPGHTWHPGPSAGAVAAKRPGFVLMLAGEGRRKGSGGGDEVVRRGWGGEGQQLAACSMKGSDFPWKHPGSSCSPPLFSSGLFLMFLEQRVGKGSTWAHSGLTGQLGPKSPYPACHAHSAPLHSSDLRREPEFAQLCAANPRKRPSEGHGG